MFGSSGSPPKNGEGSSASDGDTPMSDASKPGEEGGGGDKRSGGSPQGRPAGEAAEKKRRSSGVGGKASSLLASAKNSLHFSPNPNSAGFMRGEQNTQTPLQKLGKQDPALSVPQGQHNNSAGEVRTPGAPFLLRHLLLLYVAGGTTPRYPLHKK